LAKDLTIKTAIKWYQHFIKSKKIRNNPSAALLEMTDDGVSESDVNEKKISVFTISYFDLTITI
jgi:hypothetical protein